MKDVFRDRICAYGVIYDPDDMSVNASADGDNIIIPKGMLRFVDNDRELALVIVNDRISF